jgi:hypothetical protein
MQESALYLEADEDITSAIDKLTRSNSKTVQIVVPKRSTMLQSIINLKLLKKAAAGGGKDLVLVTSDRIAVELAGRVGLAVAPSLGAKAVVAEIEKPGRLDKDEEVIEADEPEPPPAEEPPTAPKPPRKPLLSRRPVSEPPAPAPDSDAAAIAPGAPDGQKKPKIKVPNYRKLQRRAMWLGSAAVLVVGYFVFMYFGTKAGITLFVNGSKVAIDTTFAVDTAGGHVGSGVIAGQVVTVSKDLSGPFTPTGQKDEGTKASGQMTISNCYDANPHKLVTGTRFVAPDGNLFRSTDDVTVPGGSGSFFGCDSPGTATVNVESDQNGDKYNEASASYTMPGLPAAEQSGKNAIIAKGGQMSGGSSKVVTVVTQADVDTAKAALLTKDKDNSARDLAGHMPSGYTPISASQAANVTVTQPSPAVGSEGTSGTLQLKVTYTVLVVKQTDYKDLVEVQEKKQIGSDNDIYDNGIGAAQVTASDKDSSGRATFHFTTEAYGGKKLNRVDLAKQLAGKRFGDATDLAQGLPGVSKAEINLWPAWASNLPTRTSNIKISIKVSDK